jgi:hypothetical protein
MTDPEAELDALVNMLEAAGLAARYVTEDGAQAMRLTPKGGQVARTLALSGDETTLDVLLDAADAGSRRE